MDDGWRARRACFRMVRRGKDSVSSTATCPCVSVAAVRTSRFSAVLGAVRSPRIGWAPYPRVDRAGSAHAPVAGLMSRVPRGRRLSRAWRAPPRSRCARKPVTSSACAAGPLFSLQPSSPVQPTALPPAAPPCFTRGTCGGIFNAVGREAGSSLRLLGSGIRNPTHLQPLPVREEAFAHPRRPRAERGSPSRRIS